MINTIGIQEAWEAAGGNPGIKATKADLIEALSSLDEACDAIRDDAGQQGAEDVELLMQSIKPATVYGDGSRDWIVTGSHLRELARRLTAPLHQPAKTYTLDEILDDLGPEHRAKVEKRFQELLADYHSQEPVSSSQPAKPAGAVPMPVMEILDRREVTPLCDHVVMGYTEAQGIAYGNAREAAVPHALREKLRSCEEALAAAEARGAAAVDVARAGIQGPSVTLVFESQEAADRYYHRTREAMQVAQNAPIPPQPTAEPAVREAAGPQHEQGGA